MQRKYTKNTTQTTLHSVMPHASKQTPYHRLTSWLEDSHAKHFLTQEKEWGSMTRGEHYFLRSAGFSKTKNPHIFYSKTLEAYYLTTMDVLSRQCLGFSPTSAIMLNGRLLIVKTTEYHKTGNEYTLKDFLERERRGREILSLRGNGKQTQTHNTVKPLNNKPQAQKVYSTDGIAPTLMANGGGQGGKTGLYKVNAPIYDNTRPVRVRKYSLQTKEIQTLLRSHKKQEGLSNKQISQELDIKQSEVEHWFRTDKYWNAPPPNVWYDLKQLLHITTEEYDEQITTFEIRESKHDMQGRVYQEEGIAPTILSSPPAIKKMDGVGNTRQIDEERVMPCTKDGNFFAITTMWRDQHFSKKQDNYVFEKQKIQKIGNIRNNGKSQSGDVYDPKGLAPTLCATDYKNPTKIYLKNNTKQGYIEAQENDGIVLGQPRARGRVQKQRSPTLLTGDGCGCGTLTNYRIRRLTPIECERLQGFPDNYTKYGYDGEEMSDTQRYKMIGNAVTTTVIRDIFNTWTLYEE